MNFPMKHKQTHREQTWLPRVQGGGGGKDWEFGISRRKLLYIGWINTKVLLYSTGNYIPYPVINYNGKEYEKESACVWVTLLYSRNEHNTVHQLYFDKTKTRKKRKRGTSLVAQWLRRWASKARGEDLIPGQGTKILHAVQCGQIIKKNFFFAFRAFWGKLLILSLPPAPLPVPPQCLCPGCSLCLAYFSLPCLPPPTCISPASFSSQLKLLPEVFTDPPDQVHPPSSILLTPCSFLEVTTVVISYFSVGLCIEHWSPSLDCEVSNGRDLVSLGHCRVPSTQQRPGTL